VRACHTVGNIKAGYEWPPNWPTFGQAILVRDGGSRQHLVISETYMAKRKKTTRKKTSNKRKSKKAMRSLSVLPGFVQDAGNQASRKKRH
jgi:hypothetical protein